MSVIVGIQLQRLRLRLAERRLALHITDAAAQFVAHEGFDPSFGARPLQRVLQRKVEDPIALAVLQGVYRDGDTIMVDVADGTLTFA